MILRAKARFIQTCFIRPARASSSRPHLVGLMAALLARARGAMVASPLHTVASLLLSPSPFLTPWTTELRRPLSSAAFSFERTPMLPATVALLDGVRRGDRGSLSRAITLSESPSP